MVIMVVVVVVVVLLLLLLLLLLLETSVTLDHTRTRQFPAVKDGRGSGSVLQGSTDVTTPDAQNKQSQPLPTHPVHVSMCTSISNATWLTPRNSCGGDGDGGRWALVHVRRGVGVSWARGEGL